MSKVHCYTSVSLNYLGRARVWANSLRRHHPDWTIWICISDEIPAGCSFNLDDEPFDRVIWIDDLPVADLARWVFKHNVIELCTAVKGYVLNHILRTGADIVVYVDPDIVHFNTLDPVLGALETGSIVLTPHLVDPEQTTAGVWENERSALLHGVYNLGFLAVKNSVEGRRFAEWWERRLSSFCFEQASDGIYTDQRWCDLVPAFFDEVSVLRDPGFNVASWNINRRRIAFNKEGDLTANGQPLRFYHFTKIDHVGEQMIERYLGSSLALLEVLKWYKSALETNVMAGLPARYWAFAHYSDGTTIKQADRRIYRERSDLQQSFPDPFDASGYLGWLKENTTGL